jgi:integrase
MLYSGGGTWEVAMARRRRETLSFYKRNGIWYARAWDEVAGKYTSGKSTRETNRTKAGVVGQRMLDDGTFFRIGPNALVIDYLKSYWQDPSRPLSAEYRSQSLSYIQKNISRYPGIQRLRLDSIRRPHLNRFSEWLELKSGLSSRSAARALQVVTVALNHAFEMGEITQDIARRPRKPKATVRPRGILTVEEMKAVLAWRPDDDRIRAAILLAGLAGLRRGEIRALTWQSVDFLQNVIVVESNYTDQDGIKPPKAESYRVVPMIEPLSVCLSLLLMRTPYPDSEDFVISNLERGKPVSITTIKRGFRTALAEIGIDESARKRRNLVFHGLRHFYASIIRDAGLSAFAASRLTGQRSERVLDSYSHSSIIELDEARKRLGDRLNLDSPYSH